MYAPVNKLQILFVKIINKIYSVRGKNTTNIILQQVILENLVIILVSFTIPRVP